MRRGLDVEMTKRNYFGEVYRMVRRIPRGRVSTYGRIAELTGNPGAVRAVGWALHALHGPDTGVPWHRVVNARGRISLTDESDVTLQRKLLEAEGVVFSDSGRIDLRKHGWPRPRTAQATVQGSGE
jgi:methylated-DNA-protein-cysteine methyltransferase-like protein